MRNIGLEGDMESKMSMITLKGMTWDHERGYDPLVETTKTFEKMFPNATIAWEKRSLKDFGDFPVAILAETYDMIIVDHPFMAQAYDEGILVDLKEYLPQEVFDTLAKNSVGNSFGSYEFKGTFQGLAVDAAAQVTAIRRNFFEQEGLDIPVSYDDVIALAKKLPEGKKIALTGCPTDIIDTYYTYCYQEVGNAFFDMKDGIALDLGVRSIDRLRLLFSYAHEMSLDANPIQILDAMSTKDEIVYTPYLFGYTNYSREGYRPHKVSFVNAPFLNDERRTTVLGGAGIAVSKKCKQKELAMEFVKLVTKPEVQAGEYYWKSGQPSDLTAWKSGEINADCDNFFLNTLETLENAYTRPKIAHWNDFQEEAGKWLHSVILTDITAAEIVQGINKMYQRICC